MAEMAVTTTIGWVGGVSWASSGRLTSPVASPATSLAPLATLASLASALASVGSGSDGVYLGLILT